MTHWKTKLTLVFTASLFVALAPLAVAFDNMQTDLSAQDILTRSQAAYDALSSYSDDAATVHSVGGKKDHTWRTRIRVGRPNLYLVEWHEETPDSLSSSGSNDFAFWSQGDGAYGGSRERGFGRFPGEALLQMATQDMAYIPYIFFSSKSAGNPLCCAVSRYVLAPDERVGDVDCYVLTGAQLVRDGEIYTLWIGKNDFLIRQIRAVSLHGVTTQTHSNIVMNVQMSSADFAPPKPNE